MAGAGPGLHVGIDIGGTKVLACEVDEAGAVLRSTRRDTPGRHADPRLLDDAVTSALDELSAGRALVAVGLSVAGLVDHDRVHFSTHLPWQEDDTLARLTARWGVPVVMDNDVACAAVAEIAFGAGRGGASFLLVTVGTGIGGAVVHAGTVLRGAHGMAGEFGHVRVVPDGHDCECGLRGCLEQYVSGNALVRLAGAAYADGPAVSAAARAGDATALAALASVGDWLGVGLGGLVSSFDPELIVIGGGASGAGDLLLEPARRAMARSVVGSGHRPLPAVVLAQCGPAAGAVGAAHLARTARPR